MASLRSRATVVCLPMCARKVAAIASGGSDGAWNRPTDEESVPPQTFNVSIRSMPSLLSQDVRTRINRLRTRRSQVRVLQGSTYASFSLQYRGIHDVGGVTVCVGDDLIEDVGELDLVFVPRHVADVRVQMTLFIVSNGWFGSFIGSSSNTSTAAIPGRPDCSARTRALGSINWARLVLTSSAEAFMDDRSAQVTMDRVSGTSRMCRVTTSHVS